MNIIRENALLKEVVSKYLNFKLFDEEKLVDFDNTHYVIKVAGE